MPTPARVPGGLSPEAKEAPVPPPPLPTSFDNFDDIPDGPVTPSPLGGPAVEPAPAMVATTSPVAPPPVPTPTQAAPASVGGLTRRPPTASAGFVPPVTAAPPPMAMLRADAVAEETVMRADPFVPEAHEFHEPTAPEDPVAFEEAAPPAAAYKELPKELAEADDDLSWIAEAPAPMAMAVPDPDTDDSWELGIELTPDDEPTAIHAADAPVYGNLGRADDPFAVAPAQAQAAKTTTNPQRPWEQNAGAVPPPTLPKIPFAGAKPEGSGRTLITLGLVGVIAVGAYMFISHSDKAVDAVSRWTGSLTNAPQHLGTAGEQGPGLVPTDEVINAKDVGIAPLQPAFGDKGPVEAASGNLPAPANLNDLGDTALDFVDVPTHQKNDPIVADGSEKMPEEISAFAALHEAIMSKRAERDAKKAIQKNQDTGAPIPPALAEKAEIGKPPRMSADVDRDLESYRRVLASIDNPALKPSPSEFFADPSVYDAGLLPPPGTSIPFEKPTKTAEGNPIIASAVPRDIPEKQVRTLADFEDALLKKTEKQVRIPAHIKPRLATSGFPELEILSLIPTYGLLANASDRQGVLLIGDTFEGWELVGVHDTYAEFQSGDRKHVVTLQ